MLQPPSQYELQYLPFVVDTSPFCVWADDLREINLEYLNGIDPGYFASMGQLLSEMLETERSQYAAIALRMAYSHGLETFFSLLCATVQLHQCPIAWILKCQNQNLRDVVRKIHSGQDVMTHLNISPLTWKSLAEGIAYPHTDQTVDTGRIREQFGRLWGRFADEFLADQLKDEYNSLKHGLRVRLGGFHLTRGREPSISQPPAGRDMHTITRSEFGSSFYVPKKLQDRSNFTLEHLSVNWDPRKFSHALNLISMSIGNLTAFLKSSAGVADKPITVFAPAEDSYWDEPWKYESSSGAIKWHPGYSEQDIPVLSNQDILSSYKSG